MGEAIDRLVRLASVTVVVPPYPRLRDGRVQQVSGYTYERELSLPQPAAVEWPNGAGTAAGSPEVIGEEAAEVSTIVGRLRERLSAGPSGPPPRISPIHRGPGPVMTREEAEEWSRSSSIPGPWYHGGTGKSGLGARIWETTGSATAMDLLGRGYYVSDRQGVADGYGGGGGVTRAVYLNVQKPLVIGSSEWNDLKVSPEVDQLVARYPRLNRIFAMQAVAQRYGFDALVQRKEFEGTSVTTVSVWDARKAAIVEEDVRSPIASMFA